MVKGYVISTSVKGMDMNKPIQRKTTLKWSSDGELSSIDMARILELLANKELTQCVLACDAKRKSSEILFHLKEHL
tara:strand:+ start:607 stop:834 length:228 start_codon:yes stop_codon:yes gene_type:complete